MSYSTGMASAKPRAERILRKSLAGWTSLITSVVLSGAETPEMVWLFWKLASCGAVAVDLTALAYSAQYADIPAITGTKYSGLPTPSTGLHIALNSRTKSPATTARGGLEFHIASERRWNV